MFMIRPLKNQCGVVSSGSWQEPAILFRLSEVPSYFSIYLPRHDHAYSMTRSIRYRFPCCLAKKEMGILWNDMGVALL